MVSVNNRLIVRMIHIDNPGTSTYKHCKFLQINRYSERLDHNS